MAEAATPDRPSRKDDILRRLGIAAGILLVIGILAFGWVWFAPCWLGGCAPVEDLAEFQAEGSQLLDLEGRPFARLATVNRRIVSLDSLPEHVPQAFLAVEDQRFYDHGGVDFRRLVGALVANIRAGGVAEGGSTITQQLARNLFPEWLPYTERSVRRKIMEARVARQIERNFSKDKILELYLNHIYLGSGAYGIEAASRAYFGKSAADLTLAEAAVLGGLPQAPSELNPRANEERSLERRNLVLREMNQAGYISEAEAAEARQAELVLASDADTDEMDSLYFVERVRREMQEIVGSRFYTAGLKIYTTMDRGAQSAAEQELEQQLRAIENGRYGTYRHTTYEATVTGEEGGSSDASGRTPYLQGAVIMMDASNGGVRALVGGRDFEDSNFDRAVQAQRQPGSAFKPFVYLTALQRYGSPIRPVEDAPIRLVTSGGQTWEPRNYTGTYDGEMTLREALTRSKNTATVRLAQDVGMSSVIRTARRLGIRSEVPNLPSTALGAGEVRPIEMVTAYAAFANGGMRVEPHFIRRVEDRHGRVVWQSSSSRDQVIDPAEAWLLTNILQDVVDRGTGTAVRAAGFRGPAAGKTGTTNDGSDAWFIGYTPEIVTGVWIGLDDPQTIVPGGTGGQLAAPVWGRVMSNVYQNRPMPEPWRRPASISTAEVDRTTGQVVSESCPARGPTYTEYFLNSPPRGVDCRPLGGTLAYDSIWGDEEWAGDTTNIGREPGDFEGIDWPELDSLRRSLPDDRDTADRRREDPADRRAPTPMPEPEPTPDPTPEPEPARPTPAERDLPGRPVDPNRERRPPPADSLRMPAAAERPNV